jgi:hypothetical protein
MLSFHASFYVKEVLRWYLALRFVLLWKYGTLPFARYSLRQLPFKYIKAELQST